MHFTVCAKALATFALAGAMGAAHAVLIVDTGEPYLPGSGSAVAQYQYLANPFSVDQAYQIQSVSTHLQFTAPYFNSAGSYSLVLYADNAGLPGSKLFSWDAGYVAADASGAWQGATGLDWNIGAGNYWLAIEAPDSPLEVIASGPSIALGTGVLKGGEAGAWQLNASTAFSLRIDAVSAVPEPGSFGLMALGALGLGIARRRATR